MQSHHQVHRSTAPSFKCTIRFSIGDVQSIIDCNQPVNMRNVIVIGFCQLFQPSVQVMQWPHILQYTWKMILSIHFYMDYGISWVESYADKSLCNWASKGTNGEHYSSWFMY